MDAATSHESSLDKAAEKALIKVLLARVIIAHDLLQSPMKHILAMQVETK